MRRLLTLLAAGGSALLLLAAPGCSRTAPAPQAAPLVGEPPKKDPAPEPGKVPKKGGDPEPGKVPEEAGGGEPAGDPPRVSPDETVETLTVKLDVGAGGDDLDEPVALDLGLGFPLWLHPVGRKADESPPFGAAPQQTTAKGKVGAGSRVTFTFRVKGDPGQDVLRTTAQLLAGVRVSDIARVGFASRGASNWELAAYAITINGKAFVSGKPGVKAGEREAARKKLADVAARVGPLDQELADLRALVNAKLATEADVKRQAEIEASLPALAAERAWLQGQLEGKYPFFEDKGYKAPGAGKPAVRSARATLVTYNHTGADTQNYVFLRAGGRKYLLGSPATPLSAAGGPQEFPLDLLAGPLPEADLRGWAVGMLAHPGPYDTVPDRWHPQRILAEADGKAVYDSDADDLDRRSLAAIRVIPPAHRDRDGALVKNTPISRETFLWEAGKGAGLDLAKGVPLPLPGKDDPAFPRPEPGATTDVGVPDPKDDPKVDPKEDPKDDPGFDPKDDPKQDDPKVDPKEDPKDDPNLPDPNQPEEPPAGLPAGGFLPPPFPGERPLPPPPVIVVVNNPPPVVVVPPAWGLPPQVVQVRLGAGWKTDDPFTVLWDVVGNEGEVDRYEISLVEVQPENPARYARVFPLGAAPRGFRSFTGTPLGLFGAAPAPRYLAAVVTAVPTFTARLQTMNAQIGAARTIFPAGTSPFPFRHLNFGGGPPVFGTTAVWEWRNPPLPWGWPRRRPVGPELPPPQRSVWRGVGELVSDNGIRFESGGLGLHIGMRPALAGEQLRVYLRVPVLPPLRRYRVLIDVGFLGGEGATGSVTADLAWAWTRWNNSVILPVRRPPPRVATAGGPMPVPFSVPVDFGKAPANARFVGLLVRIRGGPFDPARPPALFGVRLVPD
jgi:hypothetical protein